MSGVRFTQNVLSTRLSRVINFSTRKKRIVRQNLGKFSQHLQEVIEETSIFSACRLFINQMERVAIKQECYRRLFASYYKECNVYVNNVLFQLSR